jgi:hypothetical protein
MFAFSNTLTNVWNAENILVYAPRRKVSPGGALLSRTRPTARVKGHHGPHSGYGQGLQKPSKQALTQA